MGASLFGLTSVTTIILALVPTAQALPGWINVVHRDTAPIAYDPVYGAPPGGYGGYTYGPQTTVSISSTATDVASSSTSELSNTIATSQTDAIRDTSTSSVLLSKLPYF
jgi:hypothetical protein